MLVNQEVSNGGCDVGCVYHALATGSMHAAMENWLDGYHCEGGGNVYSETCWLHVM